MTVNDVAASTPERPAPLLDAQGVGKRFGGFWAVQGVSLAVEPEEIIGLIGPNGAGKTTLFNVLSGYLPNDGGAIYFKQQRIDVLPPYQVAHRGLARTFQITRVFSRMSVVDNLRFAAQQQPGESLLRALFSPRAVKRREDEITERAHELIAYFKLERVANEYAGALSGGQRKLLEMARALMTEPDMILLDEPMAGVNPALKEQLLDYILDLRSKGLTFLVVEHDIDMIMRISDRIYVMANGELIASGTPDVVRNNQRVIDAYLGTAS